MKTETAPSTPKTILLKDYRQPDFWIPEVNLHFALHEEHARVTSKLSIERNQSQASSAVAPLLLNGEGLKLLSLRIDGRMLEQSEFSTSDHLLTIEAVPDRFTLEVVTEIEPQKNLSCAGLYRSNGMFCTQCEAESFRNITYFMDRPDVMSAYTVTIEADREKYPVLLSNGNPVSTRDLDNGRHSAVWHDPHKKPCYLFALVAGDLGKIEDHFITASGRRVTLQIYTRKGLESRCWHAMESLKWAMKWDEQTYGLEYDLDFYMIVVAEDFNMGAMENKGLNIFNASYVLADTRTATDHDFDAITAVVAHEYFHNWTGNRVTCRDWFQLSLKEGLTVFRDQRFSADLSSEAVKRIEDVIRLRTHQFAEDAGPMSHPIRPQSYISIDNFYTLTVYEKGAEVIRMIETLIGRDGFRDGMNLYFKRHDGQAVTTEDFVAAMADANGTDLTQFKNWYDQSGTPVITVTTEHNPSKELFTVTIAQHTPPTPNQSEKKPFHIPVAVGLIGPNGQDLPLQLEAGARLSSGSGSAGVFARSVSSGHGQHTMVLHLREPRQSFIFTGVRERPVLSLLRGFSAPVKVEYEPSDEDLAFQLKHDTDEFCRWEAAQHLAVRTTKTLVSQYQSGQNLGDVAKFTDAFATTVANPWQDPAFTSYLLQLPSEQYLAQFFSQVDVDAIHAAREHLFKSLALRYEREFSTIYTNLVAHGCDGQGAEPSGRRALKNTMLTYLLATKRSEYLESALHQLRNSGNMTEEFGVLEALTHLEVGEREVALQEFYEKWKSESLVINKWFMVQAISRRKDTIDRIRKLATDSVFDKNNPNKIYSLFAAFCRFNQVRFNDPTGAGYRLIADQVMEIDERNPQVAARLMSGFSQWRGLDHKRQSLVKAEVSRILAKPGLSSNVFELASKTLQT